MADIEQQTLFPEIDRIFRDYGERAAQIGCVAIALPGPPPTPDANGLLNPADMRDTGMRLSIADSTVPSQAYGVDTRVWPAAAQDALLYDSGDAIKGRFGNFVGWWNADDNGILLPSWDLLANHPESFRGLRAMVYVAMGRVGETLDGVMPSDWPEQWRDYPSLRYHVVGPVAMLGAVHVGAEDIGPIRQFSGDTKLGRDTKDGYRFVPSPDVAGSNQR